MNFALTDEQTELANGTRRFASKMLTSDPDSDEFPRPDWEKCAEYGLLGLLIPAKYGGSEWDCVTAVAVLEALGYGCRDHGLVHAICTQTISKN